MAGVNQKKVEGLFYFKLVEDLSGLALLSMKINILFKRMGNI